MNIQAHPKISQKEICIPTRKTVIKGNLSVPQNPVGIVIFAHGAGSSRYSPRNEYVAGLLQRAGFSTLLIDLLTEEEDRRDVSGKLRFDIPFLAERVMLSTEWALEHDEVSGLPIGYFGASTGAAAAMLASIQRSETIRAVVSRGGRPDMVEEILRDVIVPTLIIVGSDDAVLEQNIQAYEKLTCKKDLTIVEGASHLFEEPGKLDEVAEHAKVWFREHLSAEQNESRGLP